VLSTQICEERSADGATVTRRIFQRGEQVAGVAHFFAGDHLSSISEVADATGAVLARYAFDPWGRRTVTSGSDATSIGYATYRWQISGGISFTLHRGYDAELGRWLSEDPIGFQGGSNYFAYAENNPVRFTDPLGLSVYLCSRKAFQFIPGGVGNHTYFWSDRNGSCCGKGSTTSCSEVGPVGPNPDSCRKIEGSDGFEEEIFKCCRGIGSGWFPYTNDCQTDANRCLAKLRFANPGSPGGRWGPPCDECTKK
jgi:RHS repeat-associated protein